MHGVKGIGGVFFRAGNREEVNEWYRINLGVPVTPEGFAVFPWRERDDPQKEQTTIWSSFPEDTDYFGNPRQQFMVNYIVESLDALLAQLKAAGVKIDDHREESEFGKFAWVYDPAGHRIELWEPAKHA
jgi:predicted enzyme related to lactoylglutathione lyase